MQLSVGEGAHATFFPLEDDGGAVTVLACGALIQGVMDIVVLRAFEPGGPLPPPAGVHNLRIGGVELDVEVAHGLLPEALRGGG